MTETGGNSIKSSFDLNELMNIGSNPILQQQVQGMFENQFQEHHMERGATTTQQPSGDKEDLRKKLRQKLKEKSDQRMGKSFQEKKQMEQLKSNPVVNQMGGSVDINMLVEQVMRQNGLPDHPQQRKMVRKQVEKMLEKM